MKNGYVKILIAVIFIVTLSFLFVVPYMDNSEINKTISLLKSHRSNNDTATKLSSQEFSKLPFVVKKYLQNSIKDKSVTPTVAYVSLTGKVRENIKSDWLKLKSKIHISVTTPMFIEVAETSENSFLWKRYINRYITGVASTKTKLISNITTNSFEGKRLNQSYLALYLMESFMTPTALLPSTNVHWRQIDKLSAEATVWLNHQKASAVFYFNKKYELTEIVSSDRYMPTKIDYSREKFTIHLANYREIDNYYIPTFFEFQWNLATSNFTFGRFFIEQISYE